MTWCHSWAIQAYVIVDQVELQQMLKSIVDWWGNHKNFIVFCHRQPYQYRNICYDFKAYNPWYYLLEWTMYLLRMIPFRGDFILCSLYLYKVIASHSKSSYICIDSIYVVLCLCWNILNPYKYATHTNTDSDFRSGYIHSIFYTYDVSIPCSHGKCLSFRGILRETISDLSILTTTPSR